MFEEIEGQPEWQKLEKIKLCYQSIFEKTDLEKFDHRIDSAEKLLIVLAVSDDEIVGFKVGYQIDSNKFYSWLGGVKREFRQQGIAEQLMKRQHLWCKKNGFQTVQTKTRNWFKPMLILNLKNGFDIVDVYTDRKNEAKIILEKKL